MTPALGEVLTVGSATGIWLVAAGTARRRRVVLGAPPTMAVVGLIGFAAVLHADHAGSYIALGGVAVAAVTDARTGLIFTPAVLATVAVTLAAALMEGRLLVALGGIVAAGGALSAVYVATRGRALGLGDVRLACALGAGLGAAGGFAALAWAFVLGGIYGVALLACRRAHRKSEMCFAPFVAAGTLVAVLAGPLP